MKGDEREVFFYGNLLPRLKSFLRGKESLDLLPDFVETPYCAWNDVDKVLTMENLKVTKYGDCTPAAAGASGQGIQ